MAPFRARPQGRAPRLDDLCRMWQEALEGVPQAACLVGPHGSGRTTLLEHLAAEAVAIAPSARVVRLSPCPATSGGLAMAGRFLLEGCGLEPDGVEWLAGRIGCVTGSKGDVLAYEVSLALQILGREAPGGAGRRADSQEAAAAFATRLALQRAREAPLLLLADDLIRADPLSQDWAAGLVRAAREQGAPLMLAGTALESRGSDISRLESACGARKMVLEARDGEHGEAWSAAAERDLAGLPAPARTLVDVLAVVGAPLDHSILSRILDGVSPDAALDGAPALYRDAAGIWFRRSALREVALGLIPPGDLAPLHRRVAEALESLAPGVAALHFERAGDRPGLLRALSAAAESARSRFDLEGARDLLVRAYQASDAAQAPADLVLALAKILVTLGSYDESLGLLARHTVRMEAPLARTGALRLTGRALERKGEYPAAKAHHLEGLAEPDLPAAQRAGLLADLATILVRQGDYAEARRHAEEAIASASPETVPASDMALAHSVLGICHYRQGRFDEAQAAHRRALELREQAGDLEGVTNSLNNLGTVLSDAGHLEEAVATFGRALELARFAGDARTRTAIQNNLASVHLVRGDLDAAEAACRTSLEGKTRAGETPGLGIALATMAAVRARQGRLDDALAASEESMALLECLGEREILADVRASHAEMLMRKGSYAAAWGLLQRGLDLAEETGRSAVVARLYRLCSELHGYEGRDAESRSFAAEAVALNRQVGRPLELARSLRQLSRAGGDPDGQAARESASLFEWLGIRPEDPPRAP